MDFKDTLIQLSDRILKLKENVQTEEATKTSFILPFLQSLGYDVFNPLEVVPEFTCDLGIKKGEKIDYAIYKDDKPIILIECKHWKENMNVHSGQLFRYFHVSKAKFGILTNGIEYRFYTDLEETNKMDEKPFLSINLLDLKDNDTEELKKFHKSYFDVDNIMNTASELKYMVQIKKLISTELENPSAEFVRFFTKPVYAGMINAKILEQFTILVKKSFAQLTNEMITGRLKTALQTESKNEALESIPEIQDTSKIITTEEELDAYRIVKAIGMQKVDVNRIVYRDAQSYFAILLDDNNRKTICRFYLNQKKSIAFLDEDKKEQRIEIKSLNDIYSYSEKILSAIDKLMC